MMSAGAFLGGAADRLLPPSLPYRFFATALVLHIAAWGLLLAGADQVPGFQGGLGPVLGALHLVTLGVLAMVAIGAAIQLLPVATGSPMGPLWACRLCWWLLAPGTVLLAAGMTTGTIAALHGGASLVVLGLAVAFVLLARALAGVGAMAGVVRHVWVALAALAGVAILGLALVIDFQTGWLPDHQRVAVAHAVLGGYGFMTNLALGFATILVPMFVLGGAIPDAVGKRSSALAALALVVGVVAILEGAGEVAGLAGLVGLAAVVEHFGALQASIRARMKKRMEPFFRLLLPAWALLPVSLLAGIALALGAPAERMAPLWGLLMVFGWLLTFVTGILQRVMPFLASMHSASTGGRPALLSTLTAAPPLALHAGLHGAALLAIAFGILTETVWPIRIGAALGLAGALALAVFAILLAVRYRAHRRANPPPPH